MDLKTEAQFNVIVDGEGELKKLSKTSSDVRKQFEDIFNRADVLEKQQKKLRESTTKLNTEYEKFNPVLGRISSSFGNLSPVLNSIQKQFKSLGFVKLAGLTALAGTFAVLGKNLLGFNQDARELDVTFKQLDALLGGGVDSAKQFSDEFFKLSNQFGNTAQENAKSFYNILSSGVEDAALALDILKAANNGAIAGGAQLEEVTRTLTTVLNVYGKDGLTAAQATDVLVESVKLGTATVSQLSSVIGGVLPSARSLGVEFEEVAGTIALLTTKGLDAGEAATQLNSVFTAVLKNQDVAKKLGPDVADAFSIQAIQTKKLSDFLKDLNTSVGGSQEKLTKLFGRVEGFKLINSLAQDSFVGLNKAIDQLGNSSGSASKAAEIATNTFTFEFERTKQIINNFFADLALGAQGPSAKALKFFNDFFENLGLTISTLGKDLALQLEVVRLNLVKGIGEAVSLGFVDSTGTNKQIEKIKQQQKELRDNLAKELLNFNEQEKTKLPKIIIDQPVELAFDKDFEKRFKEQEELRKRQEKEAEEQKKIQDKFLADRKKFLTDLKRIEFENAQALGSENLDQLRQENIAAQFKDEISQAKKFGVGQETIELKASLVLEDQRVIELKEKIAVINQDLQNAENQIKLKFADNPEEQRKQINEARAVARQAVQGVNEELTLVEPIIDSQKNKRELDQLAIETNNSLQDIKPGISEIGQSIQSNLVSGFTSAITGAKSFGDAFSDIASNIVEDLTRIALTRSLESSGLFGAAGGGLITPVGALRLSEGGPVFGAGTATSDSIPALLSNKEFVIKAKSAEAIGLKNLNALNNLDLDNFNLSNAALDKLSNKRNGIIRGFADGGSVDSSPQNVNLRIENNGSDKQIVGTETSFDSRGLVITAIIDDLKRNGPAAQAISGAFGVRRRGT
jgi:TP901 family phage tail tape measure protein